MPDHPAAFAPVVARLIRPPMTPYGRLFVRACAAAARAPWLGLGLGGALLLARGGAAIAALLVLDAVLGQDGASMAAAVGLLLAAGLFATLVELALWAGGIPLLVERMQGGEARPFGQAFVRGLERGFATMVGLGAYRVGAWLLFHLAGFGFFFALVLAALASPALLLFAMPVILLLVGGELLWRVLAWIAIARAGALGEGGTSALVGGLRQFFARPTAHLFTWWAGQLAVSLAGGGVAAIVAAGLSGVSPLAIALVAATAAAVAGMVLLVVMAIYTALTLDASPPRRPAPQSDEMQRP